MNIKNLKKQEADEAFSQKVKINQQTLSNHLQTNYDFIIVGAGSSGSVIARRLAENKNIRVLLIEAGGTDDVPAVMDPAQWHSNLGSERDWGFMTKPNTSVNDRSIPLSMGKVLGGGSSINVLVWARGHKNDWDYFAEQSGNPAWEYESVLNLYKRVEDYHGNSTEGLRGVGGPMFIQQTKNPSVMASASLKAAESLGIPIYENSNGLMMQHNDGCAYTDFIRHDNVRQSVFRSYTYPLMDQPNLTVLTKTLVTKIIFDGNTAIGVEIDCQNQILQVMSNLEVILSAGAIQTPKLLMQSGIGDEKELKKHGIPVLSHLPGVGQNLQDHIAFGCNWEANVPLDPKHMGEAIFYMKSNPDFSEPDVLAFYNEMPLGTEKTLSQFPPPPNSCSFFSGLTRPKSRGNISLTGPNPKDPVSIEGNYLAHPDDIQVAKKMVNLSRSLGNSVIMKPFIKREVMPGEMNDQDFGNFIKNAAITFWHMSCTAKMGVDDLSVVNGALEVYGISNLRIADASVMPRITLGNTMAPCVIIGENAADFIKNKYGC